MSANIVVISAASLPSVQSVNGQTGAVQLQLSGDASSPLGSFVTTLATVNSNVGSFGDAAHTVSLTVNAKGLVTAASSNSIAIDASQIISGTIPTATFPALTGDVTNSAGSLATTVGKINGVALGSATATAGHLLVASGTQWVSVAASGDLTVAASGAHTLATVNANTGSWGIAASIPQFTVNAKGLITAAANVAIAIAGSQVTSGAINSIPVGSTTPSTGAFTTLSASSTVSGAGFSTYLAAPPAIGGTTAAAGSFTTLAASGAITPSQTNGIVGTTTNNNANAGSIGEYATASLNGVALTTTVAANITSLSLTAGDWDIGGGLAIIGSAANITDSTGGASTTSATFGGFGTFFELVATAYTNNTQAIPRIRVSISATTTVFLVARATFASGTVAASGTINARRVR